MRILIIHRYLEIYGGAENVIKKFCDVLSGRKQDYKVIALNVPAPESKKREIYGDIHIITPSDGKFPSVYRSAGIKEAFGIFSEIFALRKLIKKHIADFDVVNVHNFPATWALWGLKKSKPVVWMCNETPDFYSHPNPSFPLKVIRTIGLLLDRLIINSTVDVIVAADNINALKVKKIYNRPSEIIHYGIDTDNFSPAVKNFRDDIRKKYGINPQDFLLIQSGVVSPQKNQIESIKSLLKLQQTANISARLIFAGKDDTPYKKEVMKFVSRNKIESDVIFTGHIDKNEIARLYGAADLALFPVREQGGWLSPFEALSCGVPSVVSNTMGAADLLKHYDFCKITDSFENAVIEVFNFYEKYLKRARSASDWIRNNLTWENYTEGFIKIFSSLLKS